MSDFITMSTDVQELSVIVFNWSDLGHGLNPKPRATDGGWKVMIIVALCHDLHP